MNNNQGTTLIDKLPNANNILNNNPATTIQNQNLQNNIIMTTNETISESNNQMQPPMPQIQFQQQQPPSAMSSNEYQQSLNQIASQEQQNINSQNYNELIGQLQQASASGATSLPSRDIPINPNIVNNDEATKPNYIPPPENNHIDKDYIQNMQTPEHLLNINKQNENYYDNLDSFYNEIQLPILVGILYFIFQLPQFRRTLKKLLPSLFNNDGNMNLYGYFFNSIFYASLFYGLLKLINILTRSI
jgi:hypothetical protein